MVANGIPVCGLFNYSYAHFYHPRLCNCSLISLTDIFAKGVASKNSPLIDATLDARHSIKCPIVILDGIQCGLMVNSGVNPSRENGKSSYR